MDYRLIACWPQCDAAIGTMEEPSCKLLVKSYLTFSTKCCVLYCFSFSY